MISVLSSVVNYDTMWPYFSLKIMKS